jgi:hypothetical protein
VDLGAGLDAGDGELHLLRDVQRVSLDRQHGDVLREQGARRAFAEEHDGKVDRDLLAAADQEQVHVLDVVLQGVRGDGLGQRQLGLAVDGQRQNGVAAVFTDHTGELKCRQSQVLGIGAVAVEDCGDLACAAGAAGSALAELGALLGSETDLGHGGALLVRRAG